MFWVFSQSAFRHEAHIQTNLFVLLYFIYLVYFQKDIVHSPSVPVSYTFLYFVGNHKLCGILSKQLCIYMCVCMCARDHAHVCGCVRGCIICWIIGWSSEWNKQPLKGNKNWKNLIIRHLVSCWVSLYVPGLTVSEDICSLKCGFKCSHNILQTFSVLRVCSVCFADPFHSSFLLYL